jgi:hypothetical protein
VEEKIGILSTKKLASNQKQYLLNAGFLVIDEDFITTKPISFEIQSLNDILIFTSQNANHNVLSIWNRITRQQHGATTQTNLFNKETSHARPRTPPAALISAMARRTAMICVRSIAPVTPLSDMMMPICQVSSVMRLSVA